MGLSNSCLLARIRFKWIRDRLRLPLKPEHWRLYQAIHRSCWRELRDFPDLVHCRDFNDRIQWLKLFDQREEMIPCSDKILVRDFIRERVGSEYLVALLQVGDRFEDIDIGALPESFVVKTNHDSGTVILVRNKSAFDQEKAREKINGSLRYRYGRENGEWAYAGVVPRVLVEEYLSPESESPPPDYKFYVVEGRTRFVHYISNRGRGTQEQTVDSEGNDLNTSLYPSFRLAHDFERPSCWKEMIRVAEAIAGDFRCVRVDLFEVAGRIFAGELTFWPMYGCYKGDGQRRLGQLLDFDRSWFRPPIADRLVTP